MQFFNNFANLKRLFQHDPEMIMIQSITGIIIVIAGFLVLMPVIPDPEPGVFTATEILFFLVSLAISLVGTRILCAGPLNPRNGAYLVSGAMPESLRRELFPEWYKER